MATDFSAAAYNPFTSQSGVPQVNPGLQTAAPQPTAVPQVMPAPTPAPSAPPLFGALPNGFAAMLAALANNPAFAGLFGRGQATPAPVAPTPAPAAPAPAQGFHLPRSIGMAPHTLGNGSTMSSAGAASPSRGPLGLSFDYGGRSPQQQLFKGIDQLSSF